MTRPTSGRESCSVGAIPNTIAVIKAKLALNSRTGTFIWMTDSAGKELVGSHATIKARLLHATRMPKEVPATAMHRDSVNN